MPDLHNCAHPLPCAPVPPLFKYKARFSTSKMDLDHQIPEPSMWGCWNRGSPLRTPTVLRMYIDASMYLSLGLRCKRRHLVFFFVPHLISMYDFYSTTRQTTLPASNIMRHPQAKECQGYLANLKLGMWDAREGSLTWKQIRAPVTCFVPQG